MNTQKLSISLSEQQCEFIESYQREHEFKSRSEVIREALYLLQQKQLETYYQQANEEIIEDFEVSTMDGLENETW